MQHLDMPPVTDAHRQHAYLALRPRSVSFEATMALPQHALLKRVIEAKAHQLRTDAWIATQKRTVVPMPRVKLGVDGHPIGWCTQMAPSAYQTISQPDLLTP